MQLKPLYYLVFLSSLAVARGNSDSAQNLIDSFLGLTGKAQSLYDKFDGAFESLGKTPSSGSVALLLELRKEAMTLRGMTEQITQTAKTCPMLSDEESSKVLDARYQVQPVVDTGLKRIVDKKAIIDNLPGGRMSAIVGLELIHMKESLTNCQNALMDITPVDHLAEAHALVTQIETSCDAAIAAYTNN